MKVKDLLNGKTLKQANDDEIEEALNQITAENMEILDDKEKKSVSNVKSRLKNELKKRDLSMKTKKNLTSKVLNNNDEEKLREEFLRLNKLSGGEHIPEQELKEFTPEEIKTLMGNRIDSLMHNSSLYGEQLTSMLLLTTKIVEGSGNFYKVNDQNILEGYNEECKKMKKPIKDCIVELMKENPEIINYLSPYTRLFLLLLIPATEVAIRNTTNMEEEKKEEEVQMSKMEIPST